MAGYISEFLAIVQKTSQNKRLLRQHGRSARFWVLNVRKLYLVTV